MRIVALYDIHGNLPALESVLADIKKESVDMIVFGGDILPGPMPSECFSLLMSFGVPVDAIKGNGEAEALTHLGGGELIRVPEKFRDWVRWSAEQLSVDQIAQIKTWPSTHTVDCEKLGNVLFCHATPQSDVEYFTRLTPEELLFPLFQECPPTVVCGHTHMQFDIRVGDQRVLNPGSVGMAYGKPGAYWLLIGDNIELRRSDFDAIAAAERIRKTSCPFAEEFATKFVLDPPTEDVMLAISTKKGPN